MAPLVVPNKAKPPSRAILWVCRYSVAMVEIYNYTYTVIISALRRLHNTIVLANVKKWLSVRLPNTYEVSHTHAWQVSYALKTLCIRPFVPLQLVVVQHATVQMSVTKRCLLAPVATTVKTCTTSYRWCTFLVPEPEKKCSFANCARANARRKMDYVSLQNQKRRSVV